ncbi:HicB family protein [Thalassotalea sp. M1531]|uniref:HicB family protein n=1 Tax=Thalassotalea algicola TaxID=2716224 RepID=A0A7Y0LD39_9GAMM|nr:type II toxin-antitoxin system HicB family antitoxin [Thalassotalea algicola]NMP32364.1 HicB family protein [Thalassotalea algicola]
MYYPVKFIGTNVNGYKIEIPDLPGCTVQSESIENGFIEIKEAIASHLMILAEYGEAIPSPRTVDEMRNNLEVPSEETMWALIEIDITPYLGKSHKINVTLPELLIKQIDDRVGKSERYKSRSGFIATACVNELSKET